MVDQPTNTPAPASPATSDDEWQKKIRDALAALASGGSSDIFEMLFKSIISSFLGISPQDLDNPADAPDFEDVTDPVQRAKLEEDYRTNREGRERSSFGDYSKSEQSWTADSMAQSSQKLVDLRKKWEGIRGGHVDATSPVDNGRINSEFGHREASATGGVGTTEHKGLDIGPPVKGEKVPVKAPMPGVVVGKGWRGGYGNMLEIVDIYGMHHRFGHLDSISVKIGDTVEPGDQMAIMGSTGHSTGVHLHYEQRLGYDDAHPQGVAIAATIDGKNGWQKGQNLAMAAQPVKAAAPVQLASAEPAPKNSPAPAKPHAEPAKHPAHPHSVTEQVAALHITSKLTVADATHGVQTAMRNVSTTIGSYLPSSMRG